MCGIAGVVGAAVPGQAWAAVCRMLEAQRHRGPDDSGIEAWDGACLGHRRLSIFDLSAAGHQPMLSDDRSVGVVFNGAIYNFRPLRRNLEDAGYRFRSRSDTEVLVHGYSAWGIDGLISRLRGMFAFGLWDARQRVVFLVRDRLGIKPLVYSCRNGELAFASTVRALAAAGYARALDDTAVAEFLDYGFVTDARSIYREILKLPAAHVLECRAGSVQVRRYWDPLPASPRLAVSFDEAVETAEALLLQAVKDRLDADVPVGALLSGGIDSALICWAIHRLGADITAYTVGIPGAVEDETAPASATAAELGIRHVLVSVDAAHADPLDDLTAAYGEPFAAGSALGILQVSRAIRGSATVVLTGDGGDDVFLGYPWHRVFLRTQRAARFLPSWLAPAWRGTRRIVPDRGFLRRAKNVLNYATGGLGAMVAANPGMTAWRQELLGERLQAIITDERAIPESLESARNLLSEQLAYAQDHHFVAEFMTKVDGGTMFHALEARVPFLAEDLWEYAASLPFEVRLHGNRGKAVLRAIARRRLGPRVAAGRKHGFDIPVHRWIVQRWYEQAMDAFSSSALERLGYLRPGAIQKELARSRRCGEAPLILWYLFVLESWVRGRRAAGEISE